MLYFADNYDKYITHLFNESENIVHRDTSVCYYDCTNDYFEIEEEDDDYIDEVTGEIIKGFRKYGLSKEHRPNKIEDCFRVLRTNFSARPIYHHNKERIIAHFMICYTALLIYRLIEAKLESKGYHFTTDNILETLKNMEVANVHDMYYLSTYSGSQICTAFNELFNLGLDKKYYQPKELNKKIKKISK